MKNFLSRRVRKKKKLDLVKDVRNIGAIGVIELKDDCYAQEFKIIVLKMVFIKTFGKLIYSIVAYTIKEKDLRKL